MTRFWAIAVLLLTSSAFAVDPAPHAKRVALVIGNGDYGNPVRNLRSPVDDAAAIRDKLLKLKFDVVWKMNAKTDDFDDLLAEFATKLETADQALIYYAGHGAQAGNQNYLFPVDTGPVTPSNVAAKAINVAALYEALNDRGSPFNLVILDACRNNPLLKDGNAGGPCSGWECGLAKPIGAPARTIVAFATAPDMLAADVGVGGKYSPYTEALLKYMGRPGLPILDVFMHVRLKVREDIATQIPWENTSQETPFMFADPAFVEIEFEMADDDATVFVNGEAVQWTVDERRKRLVPLQAGHNLLRVASYNQKTRRGVVGPREGWGYKVSIRPHDRLLPPALVLEAGESGATERRSPLEVGLQLLDAFQNGKLDVATGNLQIPEPPLGPGEAAVPDHHWGRGFGAAEARIHVDDEGAITFPVVEREVWRDGFSLADPGSEPLHASIAWAVAHEGVRLFDDALPGTMRAISVLRTELTTAHAPGAGRVSSTSHEIAVRLITAATDKDLREAISFARRSELGARGHLVEDVRWAIAAAPAIRSAANAGDLQGARTTFTQSQGHNPMVRHELALLSNEELKTLVASIP